MSDGTTPGFMSWWESVSGPRDRNGDDSPVSVLWEGYFELKSTRTLRPRGKGPSTNRDRSSPRRSRPSCTPGESTRVGVGGVGASHWVSLKSQLPRLPGNCLLNVKLNIGNSVSIIKVV